MEVWLSTQPTSNSISDLDKQECLPNEVLKDEVSFLTAIYTPHLRDVKEYSLFVSLIPTIAQRIFYKVPNPDIWDL